MAEAFAATGAELIALQEAPAIERVEAIAKRLGFHCWFAPARWKGNERWPGGFPGAILSRYPIADPRDELAARPGLDPAYFQRHWGSVRVQHPNGPCRIITTHLCADWGGVNRTAMRLAEIAVLAESLRDQTAERLVIAADSNSAPANAARVALNALGGTDVVADLGFPLTAPSIDPSVSIDSLWIFGPWRARTVRVLADPPYSPDPSTGVALSDHLPVLADLEW